MAVIPKGALQQHVLMERKRLQHFSVVPFLQFSVQLNSHLLNFYQPSSRPGVIEGSEMKTTQPLCPANLWRNPDTQLFKLHQYLTILTYKNGHFIWFRLIKDSNYMHQALRSQETDWLILSFLEEMGMPSTEEQRYGGKWRA